MSLFRGVVLILLPYLLSTVCGQVSLHANINGNSVKVATAITYTCTVQSSHSQDDVIWTRKTGSISLDLTSNNGNLLTSLAGRYSIALSTDADGNRLHQLIIHQSRYEDGAQIGCRLSSSQAAPQFLTMIVCDDTGKDWCQCAIQKGWPDPDCFERPQSVKDMENSFKATLTGLGVCLAITIIYAIVVSLCLSTDCAKKLNARRKRAEAIRQAKADHRNNPYLDSEVVQIDPNDVSQVSSEEALRTKVAPVNPYTPSKHGPHENRAFSHDMYDDNEPNYQEIGATAAAAATRTQPNGNPARGAAAAYQPDIDFRMPVLQQSDRSTSHNPAERSRSRDRLDHHDGPRHGPVTPGMHPNQSPGYQQQGYNRMESYDSNLSAGTKPRTPGYDSYEGKSPGSWSTQSAQRPYAAHDSPYNSAYHDARGAYSERPSRDQRPPRGHQSEPRRLDFVDGKGSAPPYDKDSSMYNGYSDNLNGPYVDASSTGV